LGAGDGQFPALVTDARDTMADRKPEGARQGNRSSAIGSRSLLVLAGTLVLVEYLAISHAFDAGTIAVRGGVWALASRIGELGPLAVTTAAAWFVSFRLSPVRSVRATLPGDAARVPRLPWLLAHVVSATAAFAVTEAVFGGATAPPGPGPLWLLLWLVLAAATTATGLLGVLGGARWLRVLPKDLGPALRLGLPAWLLGIGASALWPIGSSTTMEPVELLLQALGAHAVADPAESLLVLENWAMRVSAGCAGYEGLGVVFGMVTGYLFLFDNHLRLAHAVLAVPIGVVAAWLLNVLRFVALSLLGNGFGSGPAVASFHSKTSWVLFAGVAVVTIAGIRRFSVKTPERIVE
jgi:exosortase/archaeosortase family protein